jgi:hypothetical protein
MSSKKEYLLEPTLSKSVAEYDTWSKGDKHSVITVRYWRSAEIYVKCDYQPVIEVDDIENNGVNLMKLFEKEYLNGDLNYELYDNYASDVHQYSDGMRTKMKDRIYDLWEENGDLEEDGWDIVETEVWVFCNMKITETVV